MTDARDTVPAPRLTCPFCAGVTLQHDPAADIYRCPACQLGARAAHLEAIAAERAELAARRKRIALLAAELRRGALHQDRFAVEAGKDFDRAGEELARGKAVGLRAAASRLDLQLAQAQGGES